MMCIPLGKHKTNNNHFMFEKQNVKIFWKMLKKIRLYMFVTQIK